ncbi:glycogen debranching enzyme [Arthrobacter oryzae]|nr:glycogen debranching enzyme [Arthrobacter oryzae]
MAYETGDMAVGDELTDRAAELKNGSTNSFSLPDRGYYAIALDKDKRPVDACASNMGHCLLFGPWMRTGRRW